MFLPMKGVVFPIHVWRAEPRVVVSTDSRTLMAILQELNLNQRIHALDSDVQELRRKMSELSAKLRAARCSEALRQIKLACTKKLTSAQPRPRQLWVLLPANLMFLRAEGCDQSKVFHSICIVRSRWQVRANGLQVPGATHSAEALTCRALAMNEATRVVLGLKARQIWGLARPWRQSGATVQLEATSAQPQVVFKECHPQIVLRPSKLSPVAAVRQCFLHAFMWQIYEGLAHGHENAHEGCMGSWQVQAKYLNRRLVFFANPNLFKIVTV